MSEQTMERVETEQAQTATAPQTEQAEQAQTELVAGDDLVEEVSIDGMCGVY